jgi:ATP phosphoribosyltransferase
VVTELVGFTKRYLAERGIKAKVDFSWGATEGKVVQGLADAAIEITETGSTIRAHGLRIVCDLLHTHTVLIANKEALKDPFKKSKIEQVALLLTAALAARHKVLLKMNAPVAKLDAIVAVLPALNSPTVNHLTDERWAAVETVVDRDEVRELIPKLRANGAEGILELDIRKLC